MQRHKQQALFREQWRFEISILVDLDLSQFDDESLTEYVQYQFNQRYGVIYGCCYGETPRAHCKTNSVKTARRCINTHHQQNLFWQKEFTDTPIEQQWVRDLTYYEKLEQENCLQWDQFEPFLWERFIVKKRLADAGTIVEDARVFMHNERAYEFFRDKVRNQIEPSSIYDVIPVHDPSAHPTASAPPL